jgi:hypothetical protein
MEVEMLSKENIDRLNMKALYKHEPEVRYRGTLYSDNLYHCCNWYFKIHKWSDGRYFMYDTYWSDDSALHIEITDENIDEFEFVFDFNDVEKHSGTNIYDYDECDRYHVALNSGGMYYGGSYFVKKSANKNREKVLNRLMDEVKSAEHKLEYAKSKYNRALSGECDLKYV